MNFKARVGNNPFRNNINIFVFHLSLVILNVTALYLGIGTLMILSVLVPVSVVTGSEKCIVSKSIA